mmetsp:Transcript_115989/g.225759  ORF Transcript_115989/g.225759 Transcript_115989/m.225759 type:complete len:217 (-) Transcript_115989:710-1360(-)
MLTTSNSQSSDGSAPASGTSSERGSKKKAASSLGSRGSDTFTCLAITSSLTLASGCFTTFSCGGCNRKHQQHQAATKTAHKMAASAAAPIASSPGCTAKCTCLGDGGSKRHCPARLVQFLSISTAPPVTMSKLLFVCMLRAKQSLPLPPPLLLLLLLRKRPKERFDARIDQRCPRAALLQGRNSVELLASKQIPLRLRDLLAVMSARQACPESRLH